uniref:NADH-ubiquinone oxidoreductase chain 4L n=1 Tax=Neopetrolisthes maculatus TaxID=941218 RepID=L0E8S0_9EUCA|nr:NADH dehydrogenase subunit 4L [Neopetrolisthes maculatus]AGA56151.1 NADH dehydrogenase subunit 4L [Neopetrolisthes maculatus]
MMILNSLWTLSGIVFVLCGVASFVSLQKHLLNALLSLEFIMLGIFFILVFYSSGVSNELNYMFFFLSLAACEGALGLSLLVSIVRSHGNDYFKGFSSLGC